MKSGRWGAFKGLGDGTCNLVYVLDVVQAILRAIDSPAAVGQAFNVNGDDMITWNEYFRRLNAALGLPPLRELPWTSVRLRSGMMAPVKNVARYLLENFKDPINRLYTRHELAQRMMKKTETNMKMHPGSQELRMFSLKAHYGIEKARDLLNFRPQYNVDRGLALSVRWLEHESMFSHQSPLG